MVREVISLLSSPEPDPLPSKTTHRASKTLHGFGYIVAQQASAALYEAIDSIPQSSNPGPSAQPQKDEWWYSSDDFDNTGDLEGGNGDDDSLSLDGRRSKRRRLSEGLGDPPVSSRSTRPCASRNDVTSCLTLPRPANPAHLIELLSSPTDSPAAPQRQTTLTTKVSTFVDDVGEISVSAMSSPFSSSSPPLEPKRPVAREAVGGKEKETIPYGGHARIPPNKGAAWDPISSSAPASNGARSSPPARSLQRSVSDVIILDDSDLALNPISDTATDDEFPDDITKLKSLKLKRATTKSGTARSRPRSSKPRAAAGSRKTAQEREAERAHKNAGKELAKEEAKRIREAEKTRRARDKEQAAALAEVNKIRTDKKVSTPEMLVDLPDSLPETTRLQAELLLHDLQVDFEPWTSPVDNVVKWRRKVRSRYNPALGHWEPVPMFIQDETHAMVTLTATQFVELVVANNQPDSSDSLTSHVARLKRHFPGHTLIYLIEGLTSWLRKNRTVRDRHFQAAVRSGLPSQQPPESTTTGTSTAAATSRRKKAPPKPAATYVDEDLIEDALLTLQITHEALIHHTTLPLDTARQIAIFTQHLSTLPYRRVRDQSNLSSAGFCMDAGQVKTGDGARDTYVRMLQEITRVTAPIAYGIVEEFGTVGDLVRGLERGGPLRLEDVRRCADRQGTAGDKRVGQAVSRRVWKIFTSTDEGSMDV